eukprot:gene18902-20804_t
MDQPITASAVAGGGSLVQRRREPVVPRLELDLSIDDSEFDDLNQMYSEYDAQNVHGAEPQVVAQVSKSKKRQQRYTIESQDVVGMLQRNGRNKKKAEKDDSVNFNNNDDAKSSERLLKHLQNLDEFKAATNGCPKANAGKIEVYSLSRKKWWQNRKKLTKKDLLDISNGLLEKYKDLLVENSSELHQMCSKAVASEEIAENLRKKIEVLEEGNQKHRQRYFLEMKKYKDEVRSMERKLITLRNEKQDLKMKCVELLGRIKSDEDKRLGQTEELGRAEESLQEKERVISQLNEKIKNVQLKLEEVEVQGKEEVATMKKDLERKEEDIKLAKIKLSSLLGTSYQTKIDAENGWKSVFNQLNDFVEVKKAKDAQISTLIMEKDQMQGELLLAKKAIGDLQALRSEKTSCKDNHNDDQHKQDHHNHEHLFENFNRKENSLKGGKDFAVVKLDDLWTGQMACHQSSLEKLKEMQELRKELIDSRQRLEKTLNENSILRNTIEENDSVKEMQWRMLIKEKAGELLTKQDEIDTLRSALIKQSNKTADMTVKLEESLSLNRTKDDEIHMLNAVVKKADNKEYCLVTTESMATFKSHVQDLKHENRLLRSQCDRVESMLISAEKDLHSCKKRNDEFLYKNQLLTARCKELENDFEDRDTLLKESKSKLRSLAQQYEELLEEFKDKTHELVLVKAKFEKSQTRLAELEARNISLEEDNLKSSRSCQTLSRELKAVTEEVNDLRARYGNVEQTFKEYEDKIDNLVEKLKNATKAFEKQEKSLKEKTASLSEATDELKTVTAEKEEDHMKFKSESKMLQAKIEDLSSKLEIANEEVERGKKDKSIIDCKLKENRSLLDEMKNLQSNLEKKEEDVEELTAQLGKANAKIELLKKDTAVVEENKSLLNEVRSLQEELKDKEDVLKDLSSQLKEAKKQVEDGKKSAFTAQKAVNFVEEVRNSQGEQKINHQEKKPLRQQVPSKSTTQGHSTSVSFGSSDNSNVSFLQGNSRRQQQQQQVAPAMMGEESDALDLLCMKKKPLRRGRSRESRTDAEAADELKRLVGY